MTSRISIWCRQHPLTAYFILAYLITWMGVSPLVAVVQGLLDIIVSPNLHAEQFGKLRIARPPAATKVFVHGLLCTPPANTDTTEKTFENPCRRRRVIPKVRTAKRSVPSVYKKYSRSAQTLSGNSITRDLCTQY